MKGFGLPQMFGYKTIQGFETAVNDYVSIHNRIKVPRIYTFLELLCYETGGFMRKSI